MLNFQVSQKSIYSHSEVVEVINGQALASKLGQIRLFIIHFGPNLNIKFYFLTPMKQLEKWDSNYKTKQKMN